MVERLRTRDLALLTHDTTRTPMQNATIEIFEGGSGLSYDFLVELILDRIAFVPRYRQHLRRVPGWLANPLWADDADFDLGFHVRRSALPRPGSLDQLRELAARILSRKLDSGRPLWEVYLIEGLEKDRVALLTKSHQVLVDGVSTVDLGQVLLDVDPSPRAPIPDDWSPLAEPGPARLVADALADAILHPRSAMGTARSNAETAVRATEVTLGRAGGVVAALTNRRPVPSGPFNTEPSQQRRLVWVRTELGDYRRVREVHGGTVNDVILATIAGAVRSWLMTRGDPVVPGTPVRALVPMSVIDAELEPTSLGSQVVGHLVDLPVGEVSPVVRLHQVSYSLAGHRSTGRGVAADRIAGVAGFAPTTFHALGARVAAARGQGGVDLVVTNVPGPQFPMYLGGARMLASYPVPPLQPGSGLAIGVTSYDGGVFFGITGDFDALPDLDVLGQCLSESLEELLESASDSRPRAPRGRGSRPRSPKR